MTIRLDPQSVARALGGEASGNTVRAPSPGQKPSDRSLKIKISDDLSDGFSVTDYYGSSCRWEDLKDYVRERVGEPTWDERLRVDHVARMNARANSAGPINLNKAPRQKYSSTGSTKADEPKLGPIVATYDYTDLDGTLLYQVTRHEPKAFRQRRPDGNGGWIDNIDGVKRVIYRWPDVARFPDVPVFICEGEKDADRLASFGFCATTTTAGDWKSIHYYEALSDREVFILADNDFPGRKRAYSTLLELDGTDPASVKIVALPGLPPGGDVSDWLDADPTRADALLEICRAAPKPHWPPLPSRNDERFEIAGDEGPPISRSEKRRHFYRRYTPDFQDHCCISAPIKIKVLKKSEDDKPYTTYRVYDEAKGVTGWQFKKPEGFENVPYFVPDKNPFAPDARQLPLYWPEGEKDTDTLAGLGLAAFTFGGGDGLPRDCEQYITGRHIIVLGDNDEKGRQQAQAKVARASPVAASVRLIQFTDADVKETGDVTDWIEAGHTLEELGTKFETAEDEKPTDPASDGPGPGDTGDGPSDSTTPPGSGSPPPGSGSSLIRATPYVWTDPATIRRRQWLYGRLLLRKFVSATISPGSVGKSSLVTVETLAMVSGEPLLGISPTGQLRVWLWNLEDPQEETMRKIQAAAIHYELGPDDIGDRLMVDSGRDQKLVIAGQTRTGAVINQPMVDSLVAEIIKHKIDVLIIDPFVSCHEVPENDNGAMDMVVKEWGRVADRGNCAVMLVHHTRKMGGGAAEVTVESGRGAIAQIDACRVVRTINRMTPEQANSLSIENPGFYFRTINGKPNLEPPVDKSDWHKLVSVDLGNGPMGTEGDSIGVVTRWELPDALAGMSGADFDKVAKVIRGGQWRENPQARDWVGKAVAQALGLPDPSTNEATKSRVKRMLAAWYAAGTLIPVQGFDEKRNKRTFIEVAVEDLAASRSL